LNNNSVIRTLTLQGNSLKKLHKFLPENCIITIPYTKSDALEHDLEININGVIFTGKNDNSCIFTNNSNRNYTNNELISLQEISIKCYTYPFGDVGFSLGLNIFSNDKTEQTIKDLLKKHIIEHSLEGLDSENRIELRILDVKDFAKPSFINFILELQTLTHLLDEKC